MKYYDSQEGHSQYSFCKLACRKQILTVDDWKKEFNESPQNMSCEAATDGFSRLVLRLGVKFLRIVF